ncbi:hypothetical protein [Desulfovibrio sp. Fe33]|uniref:hypothetical protein n=1 Tax=Desulfovibrio sp. Fe33 TaxID=3020842 RepID=UPI00234E2950|nr:hypothetical protein [Desulfovibrio sp. Fe33]
MRQGKREKVNTVQLFEVCDRIPVLPDDMRKKNVFSRKAGSGSECQRNGAFPAEGDSGCLALAILWPNSAEKETIAQGVKDTEKGTHIFDSPLSRQNAAEQGKPAPKAHTGDARVRTLARRRRNHPTIAAKRHSTPDLTLQGVRGTIPTKKGRNLVGRDPCTSMVPKRRLGSPDSSAVRQCVDFMNLFCFSVSFVFVLDLPL